VAREDLEQTLARLLDRPIDDEKKVLEILVNAITSKYTDPDLIKQAVRQAVFNYENQLRTFMVAVANAQLARVIRLIGMIDRIEERLSAPDMLESIDPKSLIKMLALQQSNLSQTLDYVKKIADMRLEMQTAQSAITNTLTSKEVSEIHALTGLPTLNSVQRGNVRKLVEGIMVDIVSDAELEDLCECDGECTCERFPPGKGNGEGK